MLCSVEALTDAAAASHVCPSAAVFSIYSVFVAQTFGSETMGAVLGASYTLGAAINMLIPSITEEVYTGFGGDWSVVSWGMLIACLPQFWMVSLLAEPEGDAHRQSDAMMV